MEKMKVLKQVCLVILMASCGFGMTGCKQNLDDIYESLQDHETRLAELETWQKSVNNNISALQSLVSALEDKDYVTSVTPLADGTGYTISFLKSGAITIKNGTDGETPVITAKQDTDGKYYWAVNGEWLLDGTNKMPVLGEKGDKGDKGDQGDKGDKGDQGDKGDKGDKGDQGDKGDKGDQGETGDKGDQGAPGVDAIAPQVRINSATNEWEISTDGGTTWTSTGVKATGAKGDKGDKGDKGNNGLAGDKGDKGDQGDAIFAKDGIDMDSDPDNVIFTLADGTTLKLPKASTQMVSFESYETFYITATDNVVKIILPSSLKKTDYTSIIAEIKNEAGTGMDIQTRASSEKWKVELTKPTFVNGECKNDAKVKIIPCDNAAIGDQAVLKVTLIDNKGQEHSAVRIVEYFEGGVSLYLNSDDQLSDAIANCGMAANAIKGLRISGSIRNGDFEYIRTNMNGLEYLNLAGTNLKAILACAFDGKNTLKKIILPEGLTSVGDYAFCDCKALENLTLPSTVTKLGDYVLSGCKQLKSINIPYGVTCIPGWCFRGAGLTSIDIPSSVTSIGMRAFDGCPLEKVVIPASVTSLGDEYTFANTVDSDKHLKEAIIHANVKEIPDGCFCFQSNLAKVTMPNCVEKIGSMAFWGCPIASIKWPNDLLEIEERAFVCAKFTTITIPSKVQKIEYYAFGEVKAEKIDLPASIISLHAYAFEWQYATEVICRAIEVPETPNNNSVGTSYSPFTGLQKEHCTLKVPAASLDKYKAAWGKYFGEENIKAL